MKLHSIVDAITNSSTVTFIWPQSTAIDNVKHLIKFLTNFSDQEIEENFEFYYEIKMDYLTIWIEGVMYHLGDYSVSPVLKSLLQQHNVSLEQFKDDIQTAYNNVPPYFHDIRKQLTDAFNKGEYALEDWETYDTIEEARNYLSLMIKPKGKEAENLVEYFESIYSVDSEMPC